MSAELTRFAKEEALRLGFSLAGVTSPHPPPHWQQFQDWLSLGRQAGMAYLASPRSLERRADPRRILPECRSILVLAAAYPPRQEPINPSEPTGRLAAYACGRDYHLVLLEKMELLVSALQKQAGRNFAYRCYTDTGPLLERDLAQRAGLGWIGKNTCLIHPRFGSYLLLAEILIEIELQADEPFSADHCGTCQRCLQACPTGCLLPGHSLDANHCISYLTIEEKSHIPPELRSSLGEWVFGCDLCQSACPWNHRADDEPRNLFSEIAVNPFPPLLAELPLNGESFNRKYRQTPLLRARRNRYLRNVILALANQGITPASRAALTNLLDDPSQLVQETAQWALKQEVE